MNRHLTSTALVILFLASSTTTAKTRLIQTHDKSHLASHVKTVSRLKSTYRVSNDITEDGKQKCEICPDDPDVDDGETTFALIGAMWSSGIISSDVVTSTTPMQQLPNEYHHAQNHAEDARPY